MRVATLFTAIVIALVAAGVITGPAAAGEPSIPKLKLRLRSAQEHRDEARERTRVAVNDLAGARELHAATAAPLDTVLLDPAAAPPSAAATMDQDLAAALLADGVVTAEEVAAQQTRVARAKKAERRWNARVRALKQRIRALQRIARWNRQGTWRPLIEIACRKYGVSARGLYRMMMLESGGRRTVGTTYKGLFQYYPSTWTGSWNPWRRASIFNGWAQIRATAYAISRGMGPSQWPNTYPMAF